MTQPSKILWFTFSAMALLLLPNSASAQTSTVVPLPKLIVVNAAQSGGAPSLSAFPGQSPFLSGDTVIVTGTGFPPHPTVVEWLRTTPHDLFDSQQPVCPFPLETDAIRNAA